MEKFEKLTAIAAPMPLINIDTDMIIPKQFLKTIKRSGLGVSAFHEMRYNLNGSDNPNFVLNKEAYNGANILVAGDNFGCGSSREHAPWALLDLGIRCVISTSFADIFYNNCFKNGILPVVVTEDELQLLMKDAEKGSNARMVVDLESQQIETSDGEVISFDVDQHRKHCLINGLDDIGLSMEKIASVDAFEAQMAQSAPWVCYVWPAKYWLAVIDLQRDREFEKRRKIYFTIDRKLRVSSSTKARYEPDFDPNAILFIHPSHPPMRRLGYLRRFRAWMRARTLDPFMPNLLGASSR